MFENFTSTLEGKFGKIAPGMCRLTLSGGKIAVRTSSGYKTYDVKKGTLTNVSNFCFNNIGDDMFFIIPTNRAQVGDILLISGRPKCVISVDKKIITCIDYETAEIRQVIPERHIFMGNTYFYGKIVSMFGNMFSNGNGAGNMMKMMMISSMLGNNNNSSASNNNGGMMNNMGQLMAMSMMFGGKDSNPFEGMFDFDLDLDVPLDGDDTKNTEETE